MKNMKWLATLSALALVLVLAAAAQQKSGDTAVDPVCGMTVVKANAKATFDYKGTTYYFCGAGCKEAFAKEPEKFLKKVQEKAAAAEAPAPMGHMHGMMGQAPAAEAAPMAGCPMMARRMPMRPMRHGMPMMHGGMRMRRGMAMGMGMACGPSCPLRSPDVELTIEKTKDGAVLKFSSKNAETVKALQEHLAQHADMMKKMKAEAGKAAEADACANCPMKK